MRPSEVTPRTLCSTSARTRAAVPALLELRRREGGIQYNRNAAEVALKAIDPEAAIKAGIK